MSGQQATDCVYLPYGQTGFFSKTILDYLDNKEPLQPFYLHPVSLDGIRAAIQQRQGFRQDREVLVKVLKQQYKGVPISEKLKQNLELLSKENTFTITTAHQPVIFTGPLYFAYKILHAVKLAEESRKQLPEHHFVPVFYMGSEDADLNELGTINVDGKEYKWNTKQTGAVGRMKIDKAFLDLLYQLHNQISVLPFGSELLQVFKRCYRADITIQQATLEVVNELFGEYGVIVLIPDNADLKRLPEAAFSKEIEEQFSHFEVEKTVAQLSENYKVQAGGREVNLFYLIDDSRERIEKNGNDFIVQNKNLRFTKEELLSELKQHPERFSPNVILRGVLQETLLPNIVFIGGGGELAYWLELKNVFEAVQVPYPVLVLRNSFLFIDQKQALKIKELGFVLNDFFKDDFELINSLVKRASGNRTDLSEELQKTEELFLQFQTLAGKTDATLSEHTAALWAATEKKLKALEKKMLRAERRKYETQQGQINILKQQLFPNNNLQERVENISGWYARFGKNFIDLIYNNSLTLEQQFAIVTL